MQGCVADVYTSRGDDEIVPKRSNVEENVPAGDVRN